MAEELSAYELDRLKQIEDNKRALRALGLNQLHRFYQLV